jgi:AcrR family transcriptional regulator
MGRVEDLASRPPGRPRSAEADEAILDAALEEYAAHGYDRLTTEAVAMRAGVGKATIYRRYGSKLELVAAAMYRTGDHKPYPDTGTLAGDVREILEHLRGLVNDPVLGSCLRHMAADAIAAEDLGEVHREFVAARRAGTKGVLQRWVAQGELRADTDLDVANDVLTGPVFYRHLMSHMPVDRAFLDRLAEAFLRTFRA